MSCTKLIRAIALRAQIARQYANKEIEHQPFTLVNNVRYISLHPLIPPMDQANTSVLDIAFGRPAMIGFMLLLGTYLVTGQIIPGTF
ncbi:hypothetical protein [Prochlorococcus sp. MIT 0601]|uniref:hypothetical protein n=1 Tax=unclassified Prochlorococcus TaxID=2627481 RepID=UPI0026DA365A